MAEEKRSLLQRLKQLLFGKRDATRADQKERRDEMANFMDRRAEEAEERADAAREKRG
ncbi:MAG TPA: hypothetical protein VK879_13130 [Candidatus Sulfomarinibacteraceae bacterium]|nr:hypothetical protein [Candidatus Sulfomarinibacteraceae bacterium]